MKISLCMIVKNEESNLEKCLKSVYEYVDEIIIVDTGSTDKTKIIANKYTDRIYDFNWCDDFAKARNYSLSKATYDRIFVLDADEIITRFDKKKVEQAVKNNLSAVGRVVIKNILEDELGTKMSNEKVSRCFSKEYHKYEGRIHEQLVSFDKTVYDPVDMAIEIEHIGYTHTVIEKTKKLERNIKLLKAMIVEKTDDNYLYYQLGKSFYMARDYENALEQFEKAIAFCNEVKYDYVEDLIESYGYTLIKLALYEQALMLKKYIRDYNTSADFHFLMGLIYMNNARFEEAINSFIAATGRDRCRIEGTNTFLANYNIGVIYEVLGNRDNAIKYYKLCDGYEKAKGRLKGMGIAEDEKQLKISLCMIVKDEEKYIEQCLEHALPLVDEAFIVDTGSTDETLNILNNKFKDKITLIEHEWKDDFAEARNVSIKDATGDWILILDADEKIVCKDKMALIEILEKTEEISYYIPIYNIINATNIIKSKVMIRLFRNANAEFENKVHEQITIDGKSMNPPSLNETLIRIYHYGYLGKNLVNEESRDKHERNVAIVKKDLEENPENSFNWYNLGVTLMSYEKYDEAIDAFIKSNRYADERMLYHDDLTIRLAQCLLFEKNYEQLEGYLDNLKDDVELPKYPQYYYLYAEMYERRNMAEQSAYYYEKGLEVEVQQDVSMANISLDLYNMRIKTARLWVEAGNINKAVMQYIEAVFDPLNKYSVGKDELVKLLKDYKMYDMLEEFKRSYKVAKGEQ